MNNRTILSRYRSNYLAKKPRLKRGSSRSTSSSDRILGTETLFFGGSIIRIDRFRSEIASLSSGQCLPPRGDKLVLSYEAKIVFTIDRAALNHRMEMDRSTGR